MTRKLNPDDTQDPVWRQRTRLGALVILVVVGVMLALTVDSMLEGQGHGSNFALLLGPATILLCISALIHPPLLYALGPRRSQLTTLERRLGTAIAVVGLALGLALAAAWLRIL